MARTLRVLFVEDSEDDVLLLREELRRAGYAVTHRQVVDASGMRDALATATWDLVLSEYTLPSWDAPGALTILHESGLDLPFIIVSGTIREEAAVTALKAGAHDFVSKDRLARFLPVVARELGEAEERRQRRQTELALAEQERTYRRIVETTHEGIWMLSGDGRTSYANRRMAELLAVAPDVLAEALFWDFVAPESREAARLELAGGHLPPQEPRSVRFLRRDGGDFWAALATNPITDEDGEPLGTLVMVADITDRQTLHEQLMVSDRMASVGVLAAGVAHEINNPLTAVLWNLSASRADLVTLEGLVHALPDSPVRTSASRALATLRTGLRDTAEAAERVRDIARDLKVFSRAQDDVSNPVDVVRVLESSLRMARTEIRHRATVKKDIHPVPPVMANESRLGQVFLNLVVNAAQAIDEGHADENEIVLATGLAGPGHLFVEVRDSGCGMTPEVRERLFSPFFTTKPRGIGTGLGLSICRRIVTALGGEITVTSAPGAGSTFRVTLPTMAPAPPPAAGTRAPETDAAPVTRRGHVLVIDDEPMILRTLSRFISQSHEVDVFERARPALERIAAGARYDVVLCDLMMPEMTGIEFYEAVTAIDPDQARAVIFLTGGAFTPRARDFLDRVENTRIEKPFKPAQLIDQVNARMG